MSATAPAYHAMPGLSPYCSQQRYHEPKEDHKFIGAALWPVVDMDQRVRIGDLGCGNGELLYYLKTLWPHCDFSGFDYTREFIDTARSFDGLAGVRFLHCDLFDVHEQFDVVLCTGVANVFEDIEPLLDQLLKVCTDGGHVMVDGLFNRHDVEVRVRFCDNSMPESCGLWRTAFNQHSRRHITALLEDRVRSLRFVDMIMDRDLPRRPDAPAINSFTFRAADGSNIITNGLNLILNRTLLIVHK